MIIRQVCRELSVQIVSGVLSREHVHMFVEIPPHIAVIDFVRRVKGWSSHRVQMEFPDLRNCFSIFRSTNLPASAGSYSVDSNLGFAFGLEPSDISTYDIDVAAFITFVGFALWVVRRPAISQTNVEAHGNRIEIGYRAHARRRMAKATT